jgi:hypothetical protein
MSLLQLGIKQDPNRPASRAKLRFGFGSVKRFHGSALTSQVIAQHPVPRCWRRAERR